MTDPVSHTAPDPLPSADSLREAKLTPVFLAGSIEQGYASEWQKETIRELRDLPVCWLNPRRPQWDSSWPPGATHAPFAEQVNWELDALALAELVFFWMEAGTKSPISMLELGLITGQRKRAIVACDPDFWRRGNIEITTQRFGVPLVDSLDEGRELLRGELSL